MKKLYFSVSHSTSSAPLNLVDSGVWGPSPNKINKGYHFYVSFINDYSKFTWFVPLTYKLNVSTILRKSLLFFENLLSICSKIFHYDGGVSYETLVLIICSQSKESYINNLVLHS